MTQPSFISVMLFGIVIGATLTIFFIGVSAYFFDAWQRRRSFKRQKSSLEFLEHAREKRKPKPSSDNVIPIDRGPKGAA